MAKGKGWHGDSKGHAEAAKGGTQSKDSSKGGQGWHGDPQGHAKAAKGETKDSGKSLTDRLFGSD
jgi:hypothetical protein